MVSVLKKNPYRIPFIAFYPQQAIKTIQALRRK